MSDNLPSLVKMHTISQFVGLITAIFLALFYSVARSDSPEPAKSPAAHTDLICHTSDASECYPVIFQPTEYFQPIHDDQKIPPGLHIRLDFATRRKEARLNIPEPDSIPKADLVLIDNSALSKAEEDQSPSEELSEQYESPLTQSIYDQSSSPDFTADIFENHDEPLHFLPEFSADDYGSAISIIHHSDIEKEPKRLLKSLDILTEITHSSEWGVTLAKDPLAMQKLFNYIRDSSVPLDIRSASTQLVGTAIQNNAEALDALLQNFALFTHDTNDKPPMTGYSPIEIVHGALKASQADDTIVALFQKRLLFLLSGLSHGISTETRSSQLETFISSSGMEILFEIFDGVDSKLESVDHDMLRQKITNYIEDHVHPWLNQKPDILDPMTGIVSRDMVYRCRKFYCSTNGLGLGRIPEAYEILGEYCDRLSAEVDPDSLLCGS